MSPRSVRRAVRWAAWSTLRRRGSVAAGGTADLTLVMLAAVGVMTVVLGIGTAFPAVRVLHGWAAAGGPARWIASRVLGEDRLGCEGEREQRDTGETFR